jgi:hypothetical protein
MNAKIIRTPDTCHRPPLVWVGVLVGPHIEISVLRPLLAWPQKYQLLVWKWLATVQWLAFL